MKAGDNSTASRTSLLLAEAEVPNEEQLFLLADFEMPAIDRTRREFNYTGERLFRDRPDIYKLVVRLLAEPGLSYRQIARTAHIHFDTIKSVLAREQIPVEAQKKEILSCIRRGLRLCAERVEELAPSMNARDAMVGVGILGEKMQLLGGEATVRIDSLDGAHDIYSPFQRLHADLVEKLAAVREIGLEGEYAGQKAIEDRAEVVPGLKENS